jgi:TonB-dependent starch-binding outer membrane protein SusC
MMNQFYKAFREGGMNPLGRLAGVKKSIFTLAVMLLTSLSMSVIAQDVTVSGTVKGSDGAGLPGVTVQAKGTAKGTQTNIDGTYKLSGVPKNGTMVFSFVGMITQEVTVGNKSVVDVTLEDDSKALEEVVVVGYGTQQKRDITGSVSALKVSDFNPGVTPSVDQLMQGRAAGVQITQNNGSPGAATSVRIRGGTSITAGNQPLYVIDGVPLDASSTNPPSTNRANGIDSGVPANEDSNPLNFLNPSDIASIDILKDASATAIYGARAANGVVLITTKKGAKGKGRVTYDAYYGISNLRKRVDMLSASEWKVLYGSGPALGTANIDTQNEVFQTGSLKNHALGFSGGTETTNYYASIGYAGQEGIVKGGNMERFSARVNLQQKALNNKLLIDFGLTGSRENQKQVPAAGGSGDFRGGILAGLYKWNPTTPLINADGSFNQISQSVPNPLALINLVDDRYTTDRILANISAEYEIISGLKAKVFLAGTTASSKRDAYYSKNLINYAPYGGVASIGNITQNSVQVDYTLNYSKQVAANQNLSILAGFSYQSFDNKGSQSVVRNFLNDAVGTNNLSSASDFTVPSTSYRNLKEIQSYFGRVNYDIAGKYLLTATIRQDGASVFGANNKYGIFPSFSAGWRISDEDFMKNQSLFSNLKLRAGWGRVGNANIAPYNSLATVLVDPSKSAIIGGSYALGTGLSRAANPDLKWESTSSVNIGLDFGILKNRIQGSIEYFNKLTENLLYTIPIPQPAPASTQLANVGSLSNKGIEFDITTTNVNTSKFSWKTQFNFTTLSNKVESIGTGGNYLVFARGVGAGASNAPIQVLVPGYSIGTYVLDPITGYGADIQGSKVPQYGSKAAIDLITSGQSISFGSGLPTWYGGLNNSFTIGGFDASLFLQYSGGNKILNNTFYEYTRLDNITKNAYGGVKPLYKDDQTRFNADFLENGDYLRISNLTLGYTMPSGSLGKTINSLRIYVTGQNLGVISSYRGYDPAINTPLGGDNGTTGLSIDYLAYPLPRNFIFGLNLGF